MAEALGLAASIIAVLQITTQVASLSYRYLSGVKRAPDDLQKLVHELKSLITILSTLQVCAQDPQSTALRKLDDPLQECLSGMVKLQDKLKPRRGFLARLKWPLEEKEGLEYLSRIERLKSLFTLALEADQLSRTKLISGDVQEIKAGVRGVSASQESDKRQKEIDKRRKALSWLYPEPFEKRHNEISARRRKNTGQWIFQTPKMKTWIHGNPNDRLLWGYGIPGAGKTFLSSLVIDYIEEKASAANYGVAYIYFNFQEQAQQTPINTLASLVKQLASRVQCLPKTIEDAYDKGKGLTLEQLYEIFLDLTGSFSQTFVICDALDECNQGSQRKKLLPLFHKMGKATTAINLFLTSREHPEDIQYSFKDTTKIRLWAKDEDIASYIEQKVAENPRAERLVGQGKCKDKIISDLKECANGMFLLVHFHIEYICQQTTVRQILAELERLKDTSSREHPMDPTYNRAMEALQAQHHSCIHLAFKVLTWLVKARRVLTVRELQLAVSVDQDRITFDELDLPDRKTLLDVCASLVTIDETSDTVRLVHYTAQEFLVKNNLIPDDADFQLAMACTTFLSYSIFSQDSCSLSTSFVYPFLSYASQELCFHLKACDELLTTDVLLRFLQSAGNIHSYMHAKKEIYYRCPYTDTPLYVAATLGHSSVTGILLRNDTKDINTYSREDHLPPLLSAASRGHESVVKLLLENGSDISAEYGDGNTALFKAAYNGNATLVRLLLENGADISAVNKYGDTALFQAAYNGHENVAQILLENGIDISAVNRAGDTALFRAAYNGHEALVQLLLESGADISAVNSYGDTVLFQAVYSGHETVVQLLLEKGADISAINRAGDTVLFKAAYNGHEALVRLLLENGIEISAVNNYGDTALFQAAYNGHETVAQILLENGIDISAVNRAGDTALFRAVYNGHEKLVQLLLENGADISAVNIYGYTALHTAVREDQKLVARLLLQHGADASMIDAGGDTALSLAISYRRISMAQLLREYQGSEGHGGGNEHGGMGQ